MINGEFYKIVSAVLVKSANWLQSGVGYSMAPEKYVKFVSDDIKEVFVNEVASLLDDIIERTPEVTVEPMVTSAGVDYFVQIRVADRTTTPFVFRDEEFKAQYEAAHLRYIFTGGEPPDLLAYGTHTWPGKKEDEPPVL